MRDAELAASYTRVPLKRRRGGQRVYHKVSVAGGYRMAIKRNVSHAGAAAVRWARWAGRLG
eukprot:9381554-Alexandrium_andersonii.AAC.1